MPSHIDYTNWIPTVISVGALGIIYWDIRRFKMETRRDTKELKKEIKASLYDDSGTTKYIPRGECTEREGSYHNTVCKKIDTIIATQKEAETKRDEARQIQEVRLGAIDRALVKISTLQKVVLGKIGLLHPSEEDHLLNDKET